jgi:predicted dehydrogenase
MLRIAIIGCGKIADLHVQAIGRIPDCQIVAVCDRELLMAKQLAERFRIAECFADAGEMLRATKPDVVHITTPPQGHFPLAKLCLEFGAHVYLEKPFTVTAREALGLDAIAQTQERLLTAGHNYQFTSEMCAMRQLVKEGYLGGKAVHVESHFSYDLGDASYVGPLLGNPNHWVRQLPGQLLHNILSHGIARLAEFLGDELSYVVARASESPKMLSLGGKGLFDELRVMIGDTTGTTASFCFSTQIKPGVSQLAVRGPRQSLLVDQACGSLIRLPGKSYKSYLTYFGPPLHSASEHLRNARRNIMAFLGRRLYQDSGMTELISRFYASIRHGLPPPIPYREVILTARIMDEIFAQVYPPVISPAPASSTNRVE